MFKVSQSKVKTYRKCNYAYYLRYVEHLKKNKKPRPLMFGSIVHEMHDAHSNGDDPFKVLDAWYKKEHKLFRTELEEYGNIIEDIRLLYKEYLITHPEKEWTVIRIKKKNAEHEFEVPLNNNILFVGKIDKVVKAKDMRWLAEHKTFNRMPDENARWRSVQSASYIAAMRIMGWPEVDGTVWDYFSSKPPTEPEILKNGQLSTRNINTLPSKVLEFVKNKDNQIDKNDKNVQVLLKKATANRKDYFPRVYNLIKPRVVNAIMVDLISTAEQMRKDHGNRKEKNIEAHCGWCDYELLCRAELTGMDVKSIKQRNYHVEEFKKVEREVTAE